MTPTDEIPPPLPSDREIDLAAIYHHGPMFLLDGPHWCDAHAIIRLLADERRQSAAVREVLRGALGTEPCPRCCNGSVSYWDTGTETVLPCSTCHGTGTRDVIDGLTPLEAVERALKERKDVIDVHHESGLYWMDLSDTYKAERDAAVADLRAHLTDVMPKVCAERDAARAAVDREKNLVILMESQEAAVVLDAVETMRERCAEVADECWRRVGIFADGNGIRHCEIIAAAIRTLPLEPDVKEPTP